MIILKKRKRYILVSLILVAIVVLGVSFTAPKSGVASSTSRLARKQPSPMQHVTDTLPAVTSKVRHLKVLSATIEKQGQPDATFAIEILNDSDIAVTGVTLTSGEISFGKDGGIMSDVQGTVIKPHRTVIIEFALSNLEKDVPIIVAGAIYADNHEEGQDIVLEVMHRQRDMEKAQRDKQKGAAKQ
jgi:hypothetical protein